MRERYIEFIERHDVAWELTMAGLALAYVAIGLATDEAGASLRSALGAAEVALTAIFGLEFGSRLLAAHDRWAYMRGHWIDAVALVPPIRGARILRLLRLLRLVRAFVGLHRVGMHVEQLARHRGLALVFVAWLGVMVLSAAGLYFAEHGVNAAVDSPFDALWWGISTMTTVGYGDIYPVTPEGRIAAMALMLLDIGLFSAVTATITSYLVRSWERADEPTLAEELERLQRLRSDGALDEAEFAAAKARVIGAG